MPAARQSAFSIFSAVSPITAQQSTPIEALTYDHFELFITFTLGSLTNWTLKPQASLDGTTWFDFYDANLNLISYTWTANFTGALLLGSNQTNARVQPLPLCVPLVRFDSTPTGTNTGSSVTVKAMPYTMGGGMD